MSQSDKATNTNWIAVLMLGPGQHLGNDQHFQFRFRISTLCPLLVSADLYVSVNLLFHCGPVPVI